MVVTRNHTKSRVQRGDTVAREALMGRGTSPRETAIIVAEGANTASRTARTDTTSAVHGTTKEATGTVIEAYQKMGGGKGTAPNVGDEKGNEAHRSVAAESGDTIQGGIGMFQRTAGSIVRFANVKGGDQDHPRPTGHETDPETDTAHIESDTPHRLQQPGKTIQLATGGARLHQLTVMHPEDMTATSRILIPSRRFWVLFHHPLNQ